MTDHTSPEACNASVFSFELPEEKSFPTTLDPISRAEDLTDDDVRALNPCVPVPILRPGLLEMHAKSFCRAFPGHVMYAMKCNPDPVMLRAIHAGGVNRFDAASIKEIRTISTLFPQAKIYYMHPVKAPEMIREAYLNYGVRAFVLDSFDELEKIVTVTNNAPDLELFVRIAVPKGKVATDFSAKFGARPEIAAQLIAQAQNHTSTLGVSFHVGTQCVDPMVYSRAIDYAAQIIKDSQANVKVLDVGGGFPTTLDLDNPPPPMEIFGAHISEAIAKNNLQDLELLCEAGRGLVADAGALIVRVEGRRDDLLYINDGTYGGIFEGGGSIGLPYPCHLIRRENHVDTAPFANPPLKAFRLAGPTCDSVDMMNGPFLLPADIRSGDWIKLEKLGAYGEVSRTDFNGFGSVQKIIVIQKPKIHAKLRPARKTA